MSEYFRIFLVIVLHASCFFIGVSLFKLTGLSLINQEVSLIKEFFIIALGLVGILLVSYKSEEPFTHTFLKLISQSLEWLFLLLSLVTLASFVSEDNAKVWFIAFIASVITTYGLHKFKNSALLNNT
jgi:hypothetical protein